jgi:putative ABC transport system permease protein
MAVSNMWRRKLRTFLTVLAVVIGATLIALMVSISSGLQDFIINQFGTVLPEETIYVSSSPSDSSLVLSLSRHDSPQEITDTGTAVAGPFTTEDLQNLRDLPGVDRVDFAVYVSALYIQPEGSDRIYSVTLNPLPEYAARLRGLLAGDYFADDAAGQCLLPYDYLELFGWSDAQEAVGKQVTIAVGKSNAYDLQSANFTFTVAGVMKKATSSDVILPLADGLEMEHYYTGDPLRDTEEQPGSSLEVRVEDASQVDAIAQTIRDMGFGAITPGQVLDRINSVFNVIQIGLAAFGIIALVVAAIGIINTLMMSIHERTREIGVMKAVGARKSTIRAMFTVEGSILGFMGGVLGAGIAFVAGQALNIIGARTFLSDYPGFEMSIFTPNLVLIVVAITTGISLLAGLYPANQAARMDPVDALRYE